MAAVRWGCLLLLWCPVANLNHISICPTLMKQVEVTQGQGIFFATGKWTVDVTVQWCKQQKTWRVDVVLLRTLPETSEDQAALWYHLSYSSREEVTITSLASDYSVTLPLVLQCPHMYFITVSVNETAMLGRRCQSRENLNKAILQVSGEPIPVKHPWTKQEQYNKRNDINNLWILCAIFGGVTLLSLIYLWVYCSAKKPLRNTNYQGATCLSYGIYIPVLSRVVGDNSSSSTTPPEPPSAPPYPPPTPPPPPSAPPLPTHMPPPCYDSLTKNTLTPPAYSTL